ncbi:MAG: hypothetical protein L0K86_22750 [Actinomycetia bacterium]|nr:hypothetical protein [Actinomycetes bacterium]
MIINTEVTMCAAFAQRGTIDAASGLNAFVRDLDPIAPSTDVRLKGDFVGTSWSPPV